MKIGIACDHRGYKLKENLKEILKKQNYEVIDFGATSEESTDYPDYAFALGEAVANKTADFGIAICGSGIGISIACNKVKGVRCAKVTTPTEAEITRIDNDSNIVAFGENIANETAIEIVEKFINTSPSLEEKHTRRINKIKEYEENN